MISHAKGKSRKINLEIITHNAMEPIPKFRYADKGIQFRSDLFVYHYFWPYERKFLAERFLKKWHF